MPPHCDSLDGPVVTAARAALDAKHVEIVLPYVPAEGEQEVRETFSAAVAVRGLGTQARDVADRHFFETVVRVHRAGEGAPYTGLKPAGLDHGPVIPVAERAIETESPDELVALLIQRVEHEVRERFTHLMELKAAADGDVAANRRYVEAMLGLQVWAHGLYRAVTAHPHEHEHEHAA